MCCDQVPALAIGLADFGCLLFGVTFPCFDPNPTTCQAHTIQQFGPIFFVQKTDTGLAFRWRQYSLKYVKLHSSAI
ncbi:hypothetical protein BD408DRAFT_139512 [Parasitella parasitica]|nr:hypothetical protein BD408DRAFT_139512 [Parasitella parasitica]